MEKSSRSGPGSRGQRGRIRYSNDINTVFAYIYTCPVEEMGGEIKLVRWDVEYLNQAGGFIARGKSCVVINLERFIGIVCVFRFVRSMVRSSSRLKLFWYPKMGILITLFALLHDRYWTPSNKEDTSERGKVGLDLRILSSIHREVIFTVFLS